MSRASQDMFDGAIGFISEGYQAPRAKRNFDLDTPVSIEANAKVSAPPRQKVKGAEKALNGAIRAELLAFIRSADGEPVTSAQCRAALGRDVTLSRVASILGQMASDGEIARELVSNPADPGRLMAVYWHEAEG